MVVAKPGRRALWVRVTVSLLVLLIGVGVTEVLVTRDVQQTADANLRQAEVLADTLSDRLSASVQPIAYTTHAIHAFVLAHGGDLDKAEVPAFLDEIIKPEHGEEQQLIKSLSLAPGNRIEMIAPLAGNEAALGLYFPDRPDQWAEIEPIIASGMERLVGPFPLVQGGSGLAFRLPVTLSDGSYWGLVSTVIDADGFFADALDTATGTGFDAAVRVVDGSRPGEVIAGDPTVFDNAADTHEVAALGQTWEVGLRSTAPASSAWGMRAFGYLVSLGIALLVFLLLGAVQRRSEVSQRLGMLSAQVPGVLYQMRVAADGAVSMPYVSDAFPQMFPKSRRDVADDASTLWDCFEVSDAERAQETLREAVAEQRPWHERLRIEGVTGDERWILTDAVPQREADGDTVLHGLFTDVTDEVAAENQLRISASVYASTRDGVLIMDPQGRIIDANPSFEEATGFTASEVRGRTPEQLSAGLTPHDVFVDMARGLDGHGFWRGDVVARSKSGAVMTQTVTVSGVRDELGDISHLVGVLTSIDNIHDDLVTGLPARQVLEDRLVQAVDAARRTSSEVALIVMGIDGFRDVNEALGHRLGDLVLKEVGERLVANVDPAATVARVGGDEFAILLNREVSAAGVEDLAERCRAALAEPFRPSDRSVRLEASFGVAMYPEDAWTGPELLVAANQALRVAKAEGGASVRFFTAAMQAEARERATLSADLRQAVEAGDLEVVYQPVVDLRTGALVKAEALLRWNHPTRGPIGPATFIPLAESIGVVTELGDLVFARSLGLLEAVRPIRPGFAISVNMSPLELRAPSEVHARRIDELRRRSIPGSLVVLEITEGVLVEFSEAAADTFATYRDAGVEFAIDDFGTGYSSLAYLQRLDVDFLKIDRSFVSGLGEGSGDLVLCEAMIGLAHSLDLGVIAEGIETAEQRRLLQDLGCDLGQGYLLDRPMSADDLLTRLRDGVTYA